MCGRTACTVWEGAGGNAPMMPSPIRLAGWYIGGAPLAYLIPVLGRLAEVGSSMFGLALAGGLASLKPAVPHPRACFDEFLRSLPSERHC